MSLAEPKEATYKMWLPIRCTEVRKIEFTIIHDCEDVENCAWTKRAEDESGES